MNAVALRRGTVAGLVLAAALPALPAAAPAQAAIGLVGKVLVTSVSADDGTPAKTHQATCPAGKVVLSGGAYVQGPATVRLTLLRPVPTAKAFQAAAQNTHGRGSWSLHVFAICSVAPPGIEYVTAQSVPNASTTRFAVAHCPAGKRLLGLGGRAAVEPGRNVVLNDVDPIESPVQDVWASSAAAEGGEPLNWTAEAYAVCATGIGTTKSWTSGPMNANDVKAQGTSCASPGTLVSVGGIAIPQQAAGTGQHNLLGIYPDAGLATGVTIAAEDWNGAPGNWRVMTFVICA